MNASGSEDSPDSLRSQATQLTCKIQDLLATVRREPLAHGLVGRTSLRLHHELAPETPRGAEALPKLPSLLSTLSASPELSTAPASCALVQDSCVPGSLSDSPAHSTSPAHDADSAHAGCSAASVRSTTPMAHAAAAHSLIDCTIDKAWPDCSISAVQPIVSSRSDLDTVTGHESWEEQQTALGGASSDEETALPGDDMSDPAEQELSIDDLEYARFLRAVLAWGESTHAPTAAMRQPVQLQLSVHTDTAACQQQQRVRVLLLVTEDNGFMKYQAACCGPDSTQEDQPLEQHPLSLEWLRDVHIEKARQYLMDVAGTASRHLQLQRRMHAQTHACL